MLKNLAGERLSVRIGQCSDAGRKASNQDFHGTIVPEDSALSLKGVSLAIADGISSSDVSHIAAETAVKSFLSDYYCTSDAWSVKSAGQRVIRATNSWLHSESRRSRLHEDMNRAFVCTFSALVLKGRDAHIFHVGDSRIFRLVGGNLEQLTNDHRTVLSSTENYLGRALGLTAEVEIDYCVIGVKPGDIFVMTTDGVHAHVPPRDVAAMLKGGGDLDGIARAIVEQALASGSDDNLTIQIVQIDSLPARDAMGFLKNADYLPPAAIPRVPSEYDGYRIVRQLHASSRSHIFVAVDLATGDKVALKVPSVDLRDDANYLRRFAMEEWIARRINSPHVLQAAPVHRERDTLYVVTELVEGRTLRQWMTDNPMPDIDSVRNIVEQIAKGIRAFHRKDMLHQDLRPENVMIDREGTAKIIDFGAVRVAGVLEASPDFDNGDVLGTHQYAAPEYFVGEPGTERSDLYSLGVIAYEMLTGKLPYGPRMAQAGSRLKQSRVTYVPISAYRTDLPAWIDAALKKAVHFDPTKRQEVLSELTYDLRQPRHSTPAVKSIPLTERNPVLFWQIVSLLLGLTVLWQAVWR
ncbi:MAG: bifunctional protein-serine/threonine kinase/phosphatase [Hyphomicrobiaceae bacterium]|nr:bifunctional protein-serine/threonine kinase/phosphatase [Hyphomicrobiaceae bacterium]